MEIIITAVIVGLIMWAFYTGHLSGFKAKVLADIKAVSTASIAPATSATPAGLLARLKAHLGGKPAKVVTPVAVVGVPRDDASILAAYARGQAAVKG